MWLGHISSLKPGALVAPAPPHGTFFMRKGDRPMGADGKSLKKLKKIIF